MQKHFSYIDTALRVIYLNRNTSLTDAQDKVLANFFTDTETSGYIKSEFLHKQILSELRNPEMETLLIHEFHHYLQSIFYPFLYYTNWLEYESIMRMRINLRENKEQKIKIGDFFILPKISFNLKFTSTKFHFYWENDSLLAKEIDENTPSQETFCLNDLIEDATTIFQYKVKTQNPSAENYYEWVQNPANTSYKRLYKFLCKKRGTQFSYDLLPLLVQVSFTTTEPVGAFCNAVNYVYSQMPDYTKNTTEEIFDEIIIVLESYWGKIVLDPSNDFFIQDLPVKVLQHEDISEVIEYSYQNNRTIHYPLSFHMKKFMDQLSQNPCHIYALLDINAQSLDTLLNSYFPFATHFYFLNQGGRNSTLYISPLLVNSNTPQGIPYPFYIKELMKLKDISLSVFTSMQDDIPQNCHHVNCTYYNVGLCKKWNSIPLNWQECSFPEWFTFNYWRKINITDNTLDKATLAEINNAREKYFELGFKERAFHYFYNKEKNNYILTISKEDIEKDKNGTLFNEFLNYLQKEKYQTLDNLCTHIQFDFFDFDNDTREVFEIDSIINWIKKIKLQTPYLFCYIDFSNNPDHRLILVPIFVKYRRLPNSDDKVNLQFDPEDLKQFLSNEIKLTSQFIVQYDFNNIEILINNFKKIASWN